jgi:DNA invertase Pin-like site-specific DNA recombinase
LLILLRFYLDKGAPVSHVHRREGYSEMTKAFAYLRTSSAAGLGGDKDSQPRQRHAIEAYAHANDIEIAGEFADEAVKGSDPITERPGFAQMLAAIAGNGVRCVLVETANRFARDLIVQETGWRFLQKQGIDLIAVDSPNAFLDDTPTAVLIRQILGAVAQFEKAALVAKLTAARKRTGRHGGQKSMFKLNPKAVAAAQSMRGQPLRTIATRLAEQGFVSQNGTAFSPSVVARMLKADPMQCETVD